MKGLDVYKELDELIATDYWKGKIQFTYIGNLPKGFNFKNTKVISPLRDKALGNQLSRHHVYITASNNEPAGMHHIEAALCGLPIIYKNSWALPEYCKNFGVCFNDLEFIPALKEMIVKYNFYKANLKNYPNNADKMSGNYLNLFKDLLSTRKEILLRRRLMSSPILLIKNLLFVIIYLLKKSKNIIKKWIK